VRWQRPTRGGCVIIVLVLGALVAIFALLAWWSSGFN
jgi:hypothetical protein